MIRRDRCGHSRIGRRVAVVACGALAAAAVLGTAALAAPPTNDRFAAAQTLTGESGSAGGTTVDATRETGEPEHGDDATGRTVWYRWTAPVSATTAFETCGAARFDTILAAYVGADLAATTQVASNDDSCANQSRIVFDATAGTTYSLAVDGYDGEAGAFTLSWRRVARPANDAFAAQQPLIGRSGRTRGTTVGAGREAREPRARDAATIWYRWTSPFTGAATFATCGSSFDTGLAAYTGTSLASLTAIAANDDSCELGSRIRFGVRAGTSYRLQVFGIDGATGSVELSWVARPPPANDTYAGAALLRGVRGSITGSNVGALSDPGEPRNRSSLWYRWRAPRTMPISFATCSRATFDTVVSVYRGSALRHATIVESNDDACGERSRAVFIAKAAVEYRIAVGGLGEIGEFTLSWRRPRPFEQPCRVPDVRDDTVARARSTLERALCRLGRVAFAESSIVPRGRVISQFPKPGTRLPILGRVNLEISRG